MCRSGSAVNAYNAVGLYPNNIVRRIEYFAGGRLKGGRELL